MTIYVVEFFKDGKRVELRTFRTMHRMQTERKAWWEADAKNTTQTTACYITDAELKEVL